MNKTTLLWSNDSHSKGIHLSDKIVDLPKEYVLNDRQLNDVEMILNGAFHPLNGFMNYDSYISVVENDHLSENDCKPWPIPITLNINSDYFVLTDNNKKDSLNRSVKLINPYFPDEVIAILHVESIYQPDIIRECEKVLQTTDDNHPYVKYLTHDLTQQKEIYCIGGTLIAVKGVTHYDFIKYRYNTKEIKQIIKNKKWTRTLGFQTRNPIHNCHYSLSKYSVQNIKSQLINECNDINDNLNLECGLLLQPVVGVTQNDDVDYKIRVRCYEHLLKKYKDDNIDVVLCIIPLSMRMAGPKEALLHAIVRQNYGCSDFIIGRDHAGPSTKTKTGQSFYKPFDAHDYVKRFTNELTIKIGMSSALVYSPTLNKYTEITNLPDDKYLELSGTELRRKLANRENIPEWFTIPEIANELQQAYAEQKSKQGLCIYLIGLSGAGKTTISNALKHRLTEKINESKITLLDGDVIRENLSQGLGFDKKSRSINVRRIGYVASLIVKLGGVAVCANIAPYDDDRLYNRDLIEKSGGKYIEIHVKTPINVCEQRDVKGLYKKARKGEISQFTGINDPFEPPTKSDLEITGTGDINIILDQIMNLI